MTADKTEILARQVVSRDRTELSPWVTLETVSVRRDSSTAVEIFHAFGQADYVHVLTMTRGGQFVLVRQYRPVIERWTLEFPGGLRDPGESPQTTAARELREEAGLAAAEMIPLIECDADVGRLCNKFFGFFAVADPIAEAETEPGIAAVLLSGEELRTCATTGRIATPGHIGLLYLAAVHPRVRELCRQCGHADIPWLM